MKRQTLMIALAVGFGLAVMAVSAVAQDVNFVRETPTTRAIAQRMEARFKDVRPLLDAGTVGFGSDGMLVIRDAPDGLADVQRVRALVAQDNQDRRSVIAELVRANHKPEWAPQVQASFARQWAERARPGWYYQDARGGWKQKQP